MSADAFAARHPALFHVTDAAAWPSIERHGLLSAKALCHLFAVPASARPALLTRNRDGYRRLFHPALGEAWLRRQTLRDGPLSTRLLPGATPGTWRRFVNGQVFLCASRDWAERLRAFERDRAQVILRLDTAALLAAGLTLLACRYNNGTTADRAPPHRRRLRGRGDYVPAAETGAAVPVKEVAVPRCVPPGLARRD